MAQGGLLDAICALGMKHGTLISTVADTILGWIETAAQAFANEPMEYPMVCACIEAISRVMRQVHKATESSPS